MTLIEVLAGLALLASLLGGLLLVKSRSGRQWSAANRRLEAVAAADELLSAWWRVPHDVPHADDGAVPGHPGLFWRTRPVSNAAAGELGAQVVRLQIVTDPHAPDASELTRVEVVLKPTPPPVPPPPANVTPNPPARRGRKGPIR